MEMIEFLRVEPSWWLELFHVDFGGRQVSHVFEICLSTASDHSSPEVRLCSRILVSISYRTDVAGDSSFNEMDLLMILGSD